MASEEQRRAFAEYMGNTAGANQADQQRQSPGLQNPYAGFGQQGPQNPYSSQQYPGFNPVRKCPPPFTYPIDFSKSALVPSHSSNKSQFAHHQVPPEAPTPPPAASNALATSQQLGQLGPPMPPAPNAPGYVGLPRSYNAPQQQPAGYNVGWQYNNPTAPQNQQANAATLGTMAPANPGANPQGPMAEPHREVEYRYHYQGAWPPPDVVRFPSPIRAPAPTPAPKLDPGLNVMLCHVCSVCGRMRSAGFHRHHPVIPGHPQVQAPCRRCKKKAKKEKEKREAQDERPDRTIRIQIDDGEPRGRGRARSVYQIVRRHSSPSPRPAVHRESRARVDVREHRVERSPSPVRMRTKTKTKVRYSSSSPPAHLRFRNTRSEETHPAPEVGPTYVRRRRYVYESPSPPPARERSTKIVYADESPERRHRERRRQDPPPVRDERHERRRSPAEERLAAHPAAFRAVMPDHRAFMRGEEESVSSEGGLRPASAVRGILRDPERNHETSFRRQMEASHDSMLPEIGANKVHFTTERQNVRHVSDTSKEPVRGRSRYADEEHSSSEDYRYYHHQRGYVEELSPSPELPAERLERLHIRRSSPSRGYEEEFRVRHLSPKRFEETRFRTRSPLPRASRGPAQDPRALSPDSVSYARFRAIHRARSPSPQPDPRHEDWEDVTESESEASADVVQVRRYRAIDENGQPATFVEERHTRPIPRIERPPPAPEARRYPATPALTRGYQSVREV